MVPAGKSCTSGTWSPGCPPRNSPSLGGFRDRNWDTEAAEPCGEGRGVQPVRAEAGMSGLGRAFPAGFGVGGEGKGRILPQGEAERRKSGRKAEGETGGAKG